MIARISLLLLALAAGCASTSVADRYPQFVELVRWDVNFSLRELRDTQAELEQHPRSARSDALAAEAGALERELAHLLARAEGWEPAEASAHAWLRGLADELADLREAVNDLRTDMLVASAAEQPE